MNEEEIINYLRSLRDAIVEGAETIKNLEKKVDEYIASNDEKVNELKSTLYEQVIDPANEYIAEMDRNDRFNQFNERHGEKLSPFNEELSALEGDDFDIVRTAFDAYDSYEGDDKMDEDEYVEQLIEQVGQKLSDIKEKLGIPADTDVAVQETEDGVIIEGFVGQMTPLKLDNSKEYVELFLQVYSGTVTTYKRVIFWNELAQAVINTVNRDCKLRVEGESEIITIINERGDEKQQDRIKAKNMMLLRFAKPLTFGRMGGVGSIQCFDCKYEKEIISFIRGVCESTIGYQCQSCGKTHELKSISDEYREIKIIDSLICDCGGELSRDKSLFCPECKSTRMSYKMSYIT